MSYSEKLQNQQSKSQGNAFHASSTGAGEIGSTPGPGIISTSLPQGEKERPTPSHSKYPNPNLEDLERRKEARTKERSERGPRTSGHLYRYYEKENADGSKTKAIERVFNAQEKADFQERERVFKVREEERQARYAHASLTQAALLSPAQPPKSIQQRIVPVPVVSRDTSPITTAIGK
jgi:hypothetical protein